MISLTVVPLTPVGVLLAITGRAGVGTGAVLPTTRDTGSSLIANGTHVYGSGPTSSVGAPVSHASNWPAAGDTSDRTVTMTVDNGMDEQAVTDGQSMNGDAPGTGDGMSDGGVSGGSTVLSTGRVVATGALAPPAVGTSIARRRIP